MEIKNKILITLAVLFETASVLAYPLWILFSTEQPPVIVAVSPLLGTCILMVCAMLYLIWIKN